MLTQVFDSELPFDILDIQLRQHWPDFCGMSKYRNGVVVAHFTSEAVPADFKTVESQLKSALVATADRPTVHVNGAAARIVCADALIAADKAIQYVVDWNSQHGSSAEAPVIDGRVELEFVAPVAGLYRIRIQRISELHTGYVMIKAAD